MRGCVRFRQRQSPHEEKTAHTHIPPSREKTEKKRYANLPYEQSHPRTNLRQRRLNERSPSSSTLSSSPATTQTNQCDSLHVTNKAIFFQKPRRLTCPHVDVCCKPTLHPVDFEPLLPRGQLCSLFINAKASFVSPRGDAGSQL